MTDTKADLIALADELLALAEKATPGPWQTRFLHRLWQRVRESPGDLFFGTKPEADWHDCEFIAFCRSHAPEIARALRAAQAPEPAPEWRDIATAPKDGTIFEAWYESPHGPAFGPMQWHAPDPNKKGDVGRFFSWAILTETAKATYWRKRPAAPVPNADEDAQP